MRIQFTVRGLLPKKDGANSMWGKPEEAQRIRALRLEAANAFAGRPPLRKNIRLTLRAYVGPENTRRTGDLDNFVTGICDGLQAADPRARIAANFEDLIHPSKAIGIIDDVEVIEVLATKIIELVGAPFYELVLEGE